MRAIALLGVCLACVGYGRKVQLTTRHQREQSPSHSQVEAAETSRAFASLLTSDFPGAAWHVAAPGAQRTPQPRFSRPAVPRSSTPLSRQVDVTELPMRPPMAPAEVVGGEETTGVSEEEISDKAVVEEEGETKTTEDYESEMEEKASTSKVVMDKLKSEEDQDGGLAALGAQLLTIIDDSGRVRRRLWTRADFMHIHAVSGAYFLGLGIPWLIYSHVVAAMDPSVPMERSSWFLTSLLITGFVNALSAIPMSRFSSNKMFDLQDLKANGFTFGGTGLTCMCLWIAWWFSGDYPDFLQDYNGAFFALWTAVCVGTTVNWETMLQQNFEANERAGAKFRKVSKEEMQQKSILYRLASWPNLTQLMFMYSIPFGGLTWLHACTERWPFQEIPMYHYGLASAMGYALSMFSETLRDRKLVTLQTDLIILIIGFIFPMISVAIDGLTYGSAVTIVPPEYWALFGAPHAVGA